MQDKKQKLIVVETTLTKELVEVIASDTFTIVSNVTTPNESVLAKLDSIIPILKSKAMKFNFNNDGRDPISEYVFRKYEAFSEVILPFKNFNKENLVSKLDDEDIVATILEPSMKAHRIAAAYKYKNERDDEGSIKYNSLNETIKKFSGRDVHLLLGPKCAMKVKFLIVYTNDEAETFKEIDFKTTGSASFPLKIAEVFDIPVFNLNKAGRIDDLIEYINKI